MSADTQKKRTGACLLTALVTVLFPLIFYLFYLLWTRITGFVSAYIPFLEKATDFLDIDWLDAILPLIFGALVSLVNMSSEKICPSREGARYLVMGIVSALMTIAEFVLSFAVLARRDGEELQAYILFLVGCAQFSYTVAMFVTFRKHGRLAMVFRKKYAMVFIAKNAQGQEVCCAVARRRKSVIRSDNSIDTDTLMNMTAEACRQLPAYAAMPGKKVVPCRLEHLYAVFGTQIELRPDDSTGMTSIIRHDFTNGHTEKIAIEVINDLKEI